MIHSRIRGNFSFHCAASLSLDNPLRVNSNLHVCSSFKINYSRDTRCWEHSSGWRRYRDMRSGDWKVKGINILRWTSFFQKKKKRITSLSQFSFYWQMKCLWVDFYFWDINDTCHFINMYIFNWHLAESLKIEETMLNSPGYVVTCCRKSVMVAPLCYEPCSGAYATQLLLNVLCMTSQPA